MLLESDRFGMILAAKHGKKGTISKTTKYNLVSKNYQDEDVYKHTQISSLCVFLFVLTSLGREMCRIFSFVSSMCVYASLRKTF